MIRPPDKPQDVRFWDILERSPAGESEPELPSGDSGDLSALSKLVGSGEFREALASVAASVGSAVSEKFSERSAYILDLLSKRRDWTTGFEVSPRSGIPQGACSREVEQLARRGFVDLAPAPDGTQLVRITQRGSMFRRAVSAVVSKLSTARSGGEKAGKSIGLTNILDLARELAVDPSPNKSVRG